ncbi:MAG: peptidoglycan-binding protein [Alphaproteobacteria bacterium]|nr:peptidoglycan-binding protein [Alphaproteobacteria bacterium]
MTRQKRPDRGSNRLSIVKRVLHASGNAISRHPSIAGGAALIAVTFAYVSMNAMYQPGKHPAPWFDTRTGAQVAVANPPRNVPVPESRVTTFKIERSDPQSTASIPAVPNPLKNDTVFQLQKAMRAMGVYHGAADGVAGPQTRNAIEMYQVQAGMTPTGKPTDDLLVHVLMSNLTDIATPRKRPSANRPNVAKSQIWSRSQSITIEQQSVPAKPDPVADLIVNIQKGLSNIAYSEVEVDGVVGAQTSTAIAHFQKHYRLPVTGKPERVVLEKLKEIGAL